MKHARHLVPLLFLLMPLRQLWLSWGWDRAAGLPGDGIFTTLFSGVQLRRWFTEGVWGQADLVVSGGAWWPEHLLASTWQAGVGALTDEGWAYGALLIGLSFLAGYGPWRWLRQVRGDACGLPCCSSSARPCSGWASWGTSACSASACWPWRSVPGGA